VESVGELDEQDADVLGHRDEHLAHRGGLLRLPRIELDAVEFGDAVDDRGDIVAEVADEIVECDRRVFDRVMQERGRQGHVVEPEVGEDHRHPERMRDVGVTRAPHLVLVRVAGDLVGVLDDRRVGARVLLVERREQRRERGIDLRPLVPPRQYRLHALLLVAVPVAHVVWSTRRESVISRHYVNIVPGELVPAVEEGQLDHERKADHLRAEPFDQPDDSRSGAAGSEHVIDDEHLLSRHERVPVHLEQVGAVLELVLLALDLPRQLPGRAHGDEPGPRAQATGAANTNPRASIPSTLSTVRSENGAARSRTERAKAAPSPRSGVMSLNTMPGFG
jgi:hypothetical protein